MTDFKVGDRVRIKTGTVSAEVGADFTIARITPLYYPLFSRPGVGSSYYASGDPAKEGRRIGAFIDRLELVEPAADSVNHPAHYTSDPSGVECITITRHRNFLIGSAINYLWRAGLKQDADKSATEKQIEDLRKAIWYINEEIKGLEGA